MLYRCSKYAVANVHQLNCGNKKYAEISELINCAKIRLFATCSDTRHFFHFQFLEMIFLPKKLNAICSRLHMWCECVFARAFFSFPILGNKKNAAVWIAENVLVTISLFVMLNSLHYGKEVIFYASFFISCFRFSKLDIFILSKKCPKFKTGLSTWKHEIGHFFRWKWVSC